MSASTETYYDSAAHHRISWRRAIAELRRHCLADGDSIEAFETECWDRYSRDGLILAIRVLDWLGY